MIMNMNMEVTYGAEFHETLVQFHRTFNRTLSLALLSATGLPIMHHWILLFAFRRGRGRGRGRGRALWSWSWTCALAS